MSPDELFLQIGTPRSITPSIYDTCISALFLEDESLQQDCLQRLSSLQHADGSWGASVFLPEDRLLSTLSVLRLGENRLESQAKIRAVDFCRKVVARLADHHQRPVASELLIPALWQFVFTERSPGLQTLAQEAEKKWRAIPKATVFSRPTTLLHALEVFEGETLPWQDLKRFCVDGTVGNSPVATACYARHAQDPDAERWLASTSKAFDGWLPVNFPLELFEINWMLDLLWDQLSFDVKGAALARLRESWDPQRGMAWSMSFPVPDLDDTAMAFIQLARGGDSPDPAVFEAFFDGQALRCFPGETHSSSVATAHVIEALQLSGSLDSDIGKAAIGTVAASQYSQGFWLDKWHLSPYYATEHVLHSALPMLSPEAISAASAWLIRTQRPDGGWGFATSTVEETSYAVLALHQLQRENLIEAKNVFMCARQFLDTQNCLYDELWIDKNLYCPRNIVDAAVLAAKKVLELYGS